MAAQHRRNADIKRDRPRRRRKKHVFPPFLPALLLCAVCAAAFLFARVVFPDAEAVPLSTAGGLTESTDGVSPTGDAESAVCLPESTDEPAHAQRFSKIQADFEAAAPLTASDAADRLYALRDKFPDSAYWNHMGTEGDASIFNITDTPCDHDLYGEMYCNGYNGVTCEFFPEYGNEVQCLAYASLLQDLVFGSDAPMTEYSDVTAALPGDHIRLVTLEHSVVVLENDGDALTVTEVNRDYDDCRIDWGRTLWFDELYGIELRCFTRYESTLFEEE